MRKRRVKDRQDCRLFTYCDHNFKQQVEDYAETKGVSLSLAVKSLIARGLQSGDPTQGADRQAVANG